MWSLRMCVMACACAWAAATAVVTLPCEQPPCVTDHVDSNKDQYKDFIKNEEQQRRLTWIPASKQSASSLMRRAFVAGREVDGSPMWVIRAHYGRGLIPGKLAIQNRAAYIPARGREVPVENFEVLCAPQHSLRWSRVGCDLPHAAIAGGYNNYGETLYIARCNYKGSTTPGKYNPRRGTAYISFGGGVVLCDNFKILTALQNFNTSAPSWEDQSYNESESYTDYSYED